jgi:hypothetical protein
VPKTQSVVISDQLSTLFRSVSMPLALALAMTEQSEKAIRHDGVANQTQTPHLRHIFTIFKIQLIISGCLVKRCGLFVDHCKQQGLSTNKVTIKTNSKDVHLPPLTSFVCVLFLSSLNHQNWPIHSRH